MVWGTFAQFILSGTQAYHPIINVSEGQIFDRFKVRLVAGEEKTLYNNLSSPTASTTSVLTVAAIAAVEGRHAITIDIGGAFLNADLKPTGIAP